MDSEPKPLDRRSWGLVALGTLALFAALSVNLNAPFYGSMEVLGVAQRLPARNHLRYGLGRTYGLANFSPSRLTPEEFSKHWWINHPPLCALYTAGAFALFGDSVAVTRLSGIVWAALSLPIVFWIGRALRSAEAGAWAALVYAAAGVIVWDARRPEYFQPSLFLILLAFALFLRWLRRPRWPTWAAVLAIVAVANLIDWMSYIFAASLIVYLLACQRRRAILPAVTLALVLLASFAAFYFHVRWVVGPEASNYFKDLAAARVTGSRLTALRILGRACLTHAGVVATVAGAAAVVTRRVLPPTARGPVLLLLGYGLGASQILVTWTIDHSHVAAWFVLPFLTFASGIALSHVRSLKDAPAFRRTAAVVLVAGIAGQGLFTAVVRHCQTTWYAPEREVIATIKKNVPPGSRLITPLRGITDYAVTDETDCNVVWNTGRRSDLEEALRRDGAVYVLVPKPGASSGFWSDSSPAKRDFYGIREPEPEAKALLSQAERRDLGAYELYHFDDARVPR